MKKIILALILISLACNPAFAITEKKDTDICDNHTHIQKIEIKNGSTLSILDCISIGLNNSPIIKQAAFNLEVAKNQVGIAKSIYFPSLSAGFGYNQEFNSNREHYEKNDRGFPSVGIVLKDMIWDFGKSNSNIRMEEFYKIVAEYEFQDTVCSTVFDIKKQYYTLLNVQTLLDIAKMNYETQEKFVALTQNLVNKGKKDKSDLASAKAELYRLKENVLEAQDEVENQKENLNNSMFLENAPNYTIYETQTFRYNPKHSKIYSIHFPTLRKVHNDTTIFQHPNFTYDVAIKKAYENSPDLKALVATKKAMEQALIYAQRAFYPEIDAAVGYNFLNSNIKSTNSNLAIEIALNTSINAMHYKYNTRKARAELNVADKEIDIFKKNLYFKVKKCLNTLDKTQKEIPISKDRLKHATEYFELTNKNYFIDKQLEIEFEDARNTYYNSLTDYTKRQYDYNIALIDLEKTMHEHLIDYHEDSEHAIHYHAGEENKALSKLINCNKKHK